MPHGCDGKRAGPRRTPSTILGIQNGASPGCQNAGNPQGAPKLPIPLPAPRLGVGDLGIPPDSGTPDLCRVEEAGVCLVSTPAISFETL